MTTTYTTSNADMKIYDQLAQTSYLERVQDNIDAFNGMSQGCIVSRSEAIIGDEAKYALYKIGGAIAHRDVDSESAVTGTKIASDERISVKCPWKYGPYQSTEEAFKRRGLSPDQFFQLVGQDAADAVMTGWVDYAIAALEACIRSNVSMVVTGNFSEDGKKVLTTGLRTLGDKFSRIALWVMDASMYFDIVDQAISDKIYEEAGIVVYGGLPGTMGIPVLVTDRATANVIIGLQAGAVQIIESQPPGFRSYNIDTQENLAIAYRAEGAFNVEVLGYSWDSTAGGVNPNKTSIADSDNWNQWATDDKLTAGFIIDVDYT